MDRAILISAMPAINDYYDRLKTIKKYYRWQICEDTGSIYGVFAYLNIHDVFDDYMVVRKSPIGAVAFSLNMDENNNEVGFLDSMGMTFEECQILIDAVHNNEESMYFSSQVRRDLVIELLNHSDY